MFHVSRVYLGRKPTLTPKVPEGMSWGECTKTKRICVAPTVEKCLQGIDGIENLRFSELEENEGWYVYETKKRGRAARKVRDYHTTQEHWILDETQFQYVGKVKRLPGDDFAIFKNKKIIAEID